MAVYIDTPSNYKKFTMYSHMFADSINELHVFAASIGLKKCWFENKKGRFQPHYDVKESLYQTAIKNGAISISRRETVSKIKSIYNP